MARQKIKRLSRGWPDDVIPHRPDPEKLRKSFETYNEGSSERTPATFKAGVSTPTRGFKS